MIRVRTKFSLTIRINRVFVDFARKQTLISTEYIYMFWKIPVQQVKSSIFIEILIWLKSTCFVSKSLVINQVCLRSIFLYSIFYHTLWEPYQFPSKTIILIHSRKFFFFLKCKVYEIMRYVWWAMDKDIANVHNRSIFKWYRKVFIYQRNSWHIFSMHY